MTALTPPPRPIHQLSETAFFDPAHFPREGRVLDVGCGDRKKVPWATGMDRVKTAAADVVHDTNVTPWPFADDTFDAVVASHVVEHVPDIVGWCRELHRVCKPGALIRVACPHHSNPDAFMDPTHVHYLGYRSFDFFTRPEDAALPAFQKWANRFVSKGTSLVGWYSDPLFEIVERRITFRPPCSWLGLPFFARHAPYFYEYLLSGIFLAQDLWVVLRVKKTPPSPAP